MAKRKTYGIGGLLEWHGYVESNGVKMRVDFVNGSVTANGVAPATFTTSDALTQYFIESSDQFKSGRIFVYGSVDLPGVAGGRILEEKLTDTPVDQEMPAESEEKAIVEVSSLAEAKEYMMEHFEVGSSKLRNRAQILEQAAAHGVEFAGV